MGLMIPADIDEWRRWQRSRSRIRAARAAIRRTPPPELVLLTRGQEPAALFAIDATTPTAVASLAAPIHHLGEAPVAVLAVGDVSRVLPGRWVVHRLDATRTLPTQLRGIRAVVATGHFLPAGAAAYDWSRQLGATFVVVQHGLLTPYAPPLPRDSHVLAFSDADGRFWASGRSDVDLEPIGSQLLWDAAQVGVQVDAGAPPVFLGQLHGAELSRRISAVTAARFCRETGAAYRPHPAETDIRSRLQHQRWRRAGIRLAQPGPLRDQRHPVVSIFSTGVLEAAAMGLPAWVTCASPPHWVRDLWERYGLAFWGGAPTAPPPVPVVCPSQAVARRVSAIVEGRS
ncbi:RNA-binding protein [Monashia sp. NPDC004114]